MKPTIEWDGKEPTEESLIDAKEYIEKDFDVEVIGAKIYRSEDVDIVVFVNDLGDQYYEDDGEWIFLDDIEEVIPNHISMEDISF